jgi:hypothetical protein
VQNVVVIALVNERRIVNLHELLIAVVSVSVTNKSSDWPEGSSEARALLGAPMDITASYMRPAMTRPSSGGLNQRERTNSESFCRTSMSVIARKLAVRAIAHRKGLRNHLLQVPARASGASRTATSAFSSHRLRSAPMGRSWLRARANMVPLMPPAEAPAMMSTTTRISMVRPISRSSSKYVPSVSYSGSLRSTPSKKEAFARRERSAIACNALEARTSLRISLLMPCI